MINLYAREKNMRWNLKKIQFLYPPDNFIGTFANEKMQAKHKALQDEKRATILKNIAASKTPLTAIQTLNNLDHLQFLLNNTGEFKKDGCLEETVLKLYCRENSAFTSGGIFDIWHNLFLQCDAKKLYSLGASFLDENVTVFRGSITGVEKGFCWTTSKPKADWFLERWKDKEQGGGTVYSTKISRKDLLISLKDTEKKELIVSPLFLETAEIEVV